MFKKVCRRLSDFFKRHASGKTTGLTLQEAVLSGYAFKRKEWHSYISVEAQSLRRRSHRYGETHKYVTKEDVLATDWETM